MTELGDGTIQLLWDDGEFVLSRQRDALGARLVITPTLQEPGPLTVGRLQHSYDIRSELDPAWAVLPINLIRDQSHHSLLMQDPGGELLATLVGQAWELDRFLRVAISGAVSLGHFHDRGLVHKDIKPANLFIDGGGNVRLTGFGIASRLQRQRQAQTGPEVLAGTLAYMPPEQTGRMNRSIDARSDLYAYGITLYEMLTGTLPFNASEPMEWIHCHIARQPIPAAEKVSGIPSPVSAIVSKLMSKNAEDRYQTAAGVASDLRRCLAEWETYGRIAPFSLGADDFSRRLMIPERLYGRDSAIGTLLAAFDRVVDQGTPGLILVSGYSGIGKSSVVHELYKALVPSRGLFAAGKFDQYKRDIPFATLAQAFQGPVQQILGMSNAEVGHWRRILSEALGANGQLIVHLIPDLELIIGEQPPVGDLPPHDAQNRFHLVFRRFFEAFARPDHPLALFLDDLQWVDSATLELLERIVTDSGLNHLLLVGAYRDNEVSPSHPLLRALTRMQESGAQIEQVVLAPLSLEDIAHLVADTLHTTGQNVEQLAALVHEKTGGNPFFAIQFITMLADEDLLTFDADAARWNWEIGRIRAKGITDNVVDLMAERVNRLPQNTQDTLKYLACLGNRTATAILAMVQGQTEIQIHSALWGVVQAGLVSRYEGGYTFLHDRIQEAAYALIPDDERAATHLQIGRILASRTAASEVEASVFEIVNQLDRGAALIHDPEERRRVAHLNLVAGKRAKASTAYGSALTYFTAGIGLLRDDRWEHDYRLAFELEYYASECEFLTGALVVAEERLSALSSRARSVVDTAAVAWLRITLYTALGQLDRAIDTCLVFLGGVGVHWSAHPSKETVHQEYAPIAEQIRCDGISAGIDLPVTLEPERRAVLDVLAAVLPPAFFSDENLVCLVLCRMANLSREQGNSDASSLGYAYLGMVLGPYFGEYRAGFEFGKLGFDLVNERGLDRFKARVYMTFAYHVTPWTKHVRTGRPLLRRAFEIANEVGDLTYAGFSSCTLITSLLASGDAFDEVQREAELKLEFVQKTKFDLIADIITTQLRLIRTLRGLTPDISTFNDTDFDEARFEQHLEAHPGLAIAACWYWIRKLQHRYCVGDVAAAVTAASKAHPLLWTSGGHLELAEYHFHAALARAAQFDFSPPAEQGVLLDQLAVHEKQLNVWAENCPTNFAHRSALVAGEILRIRGREIEALGLYERAISLAHEQGFTLDEALACEVAARLCVARELGTMAVAYLRNARHCYGALGADGKVRQLESAYPALRVEAGIPARIGSPAPEEANLDLATMVKTSQALSGEVGLEKLIRTLMVLAVEHAGADRGVLIFPRGDQLWIEAEATTGREAVQVAVRQAVVTPTALPTSVLRFAIRSHEVVLLNDASVDNQFSADDYFGTRTPRSVLCLPLLKQAKLIGLVYLENSLAAQVFSPNRIAVLELLASQAAISLESASLEEKEALLKEVHHRVKNNLQLISSLLSLQAARITDPAVAELFADSRNRVRSMALVHENLYRAGNFARVAMGAHIENLCGHLTRAYGTHSQHVELMTRSDDVQLDLDRAVSCGLIVNELVSNALKHAFPSGRHGRVAVELSRLDEKRCTLTVTDNGIGLPPALDTRRADSLGLQLVHDLTHQLHGVVEVSSNAGTTFSITFDVLGSREARG